MDERPWRDDVTRHRRKVRELLEAERAQVRLLRNLLALKPYAVPVPRRFRTPIPTQRRTPR